MNAPGKVAPSDLYITLDLHRRAPKAVDYLGEKLALQDIAAQMLDHPEQLLPKLVQRAMQITGAASAGISAFEEQEGSPGIFRWCFLHGELARFEGATTPRNYSPCGVCLDRFEPTLTRHPERYYSWISDAGVVCPEVLLVPIYLAEGQPLGTLWIVAEQENYFDSGHARVMRELASFAGIALAMVQTQHRLQAAVAQQETLTSEMSHRIKNLFAVVDAMISFTKRSATSADEFAAILHGRLHALASANALVRQSFTEGLKAPEVRAASLHALIHAILKPYETLGGQRFSASGEEIILGDQATTGLALVFHELATNAAKYGALSQEEGRVKVTWEQYEDGLVMIWSETGGPEIQGEPERQSFGTRLVRNAVIGQFRGKLDMQWRKQGLHAELVLPKANLAS
jgi:two-component sensor histidine kinase